MDSLTHIVLGACSGAALTGRQLGKKSLWIGALANSLPDLDFLASLWTRTDEGLLAHRGFSHSFLFCALAALLLGLLFQQFFRRSAPLRLIAWIGFFAAELLMHILLDAFNAYGTGWFEPFSHTRVSFNALFVADPFYSVWLAVAAVCLVLVWDRPRQRRFWLEAGLGISSLYLLYCIVNKVKTDSDIRDMLTRQQVPVERYFTTPTPLNVWLWYVVAQTPDGFITGYYSVFDSQRRIDLHFFPAHRELLEPLGSHEEITHLVRFSKGYYTVQRRGDTLVFNDLRFGQMVGWYNPDADFVFHYYLRRGADNRLVVQRGRFANWTGATTAALIRRIRGR
ncbi:MAG TPA: metal-dependent hydrolase [Chitinophagaceae bacterium]|nr:metal-dependent hydrolase [Chitinophagaceae bacterium]